MNCYKCSEILPYAVRLYYTNKAGIIVYVVTLHFTQYISI